MPPPGMTMIRFARAADEFSDERQPVENIRLLAGCEHAIDA